MTNVVIASAARTPVGSFLGSFANTPAHELGRIVIEAVVERAGVDKSEVSETILGQVLTAAQGQNPARQAHINAGLPKESAAWGINQVCGSGLRAVALGAQHIMLGDADIVVAGGQENMSMSPHAAPLRQGQKMGDLKYIDTMIRDGLWDAFNGYHMGQTAENVAEQWQISRDMQDEFAVASQNKAEAAQKAGKFADEITPSRSRPARATSWSTATNTSATAPRWRRCRSCAPPSPRTAPSPRPTPRASTTARPRRS
jgi:acetyl-CoA C-acetyltransferase